MPRGLGGRPGRVVTDSKSAYYSRRREGSAIGGEEGGGVEETRARIRRLELELSRVRRSRRVLMDLLWRLDRDWRRRLEVLEAENRRLWSVRREQGHA